MKHSLILFKSILDCCVGYVFSRLKPIGREFLVVGSNYGDRLEPNASILIDYIVSQGKAVIVVTDDLTEKKGIQIKRGTIKAAYYFFCSDACFYTHSLSDVIPHAHKLHWFKKVINFPLLVFLQHGVIGLKGELANGVSMKKYIRSLEPTFDQMVVSSSVEGEVVESFGIPKKKIAITGLPRFDVYHREPVVDKKVLIFFTWQTQAGLSAKQQIVERSGILSILNSRGYKIVYASHSMQKASGSEPVSAEEFQKTIKTCSLLITDDSSLAWDIFYRRQQVIFLSPSKDWLTDEPELLQRRCFTEKELREKVDEFTSGRNMPEPLQFADYYDNKNCERVVALSHQNG